MFNVDTNTLNVGIGLLILIITNIILGSIGALFTQEFDWKKFKTGLLKGLVVIICFFLVYFAGSINSDVVAFNINGVEMNLTAAVYAILFIGFVWYGKEVLQKLAEIIRAKYNTGDGI